MRDPQGLVSNSANISSVTPRCKNIREAELGILNP